jgi:ABC-2 type transport system permease protein
MSPRSNLYWSLRRELWENRYLWIAPIAIGVLAYFGFLINLHRVAKHAKQAEMIYGTAASLVLGVCWIIGVFYCIEALHSERRDRSILFWKSMPVSDRVTVASKALIALVFLPYWGTLVGYGLQVLMLGTAHATGGPTNIGLFTLMAVFFYGVTVHVLWLAPIYAWVLLVSAWARRNVFLWIVLPAAGIMVLEYVAWGSTVFARSLGYRITGAMGLAFVPGAMSSPITQFSQLDPVRYLSTPGLWLGLACAALFLAGAVELRRRREPN